MRATVLLLGGTGEARALAATLVGSRGCGVVSSLAGRVRDPGCPRARCASAGSAGRTGWRPGCATTVSPRSSTPRTPSPTMTAHAVDACAATGVPLLVLRRPGVAAEAGDDWHWVDSLAGPPRPCPSLGRRVFLTTGRRASPPSPSSTWGS